MNKQLLALLSSVFILGHVYGQTTMLGVTATVTAATACTTPCNGTATAIVVSGVPPYTYLWNIPLAPQMTQTATGLCPGTYQLGVFDASSPLPLQGQAMVTITCNTANGIVDISGSDNIHIFPNPVKNFLNIEFYPLLPGKTELVIRNIYGSVVYDGSAEIPGYVLKQIDVGFLPAGVYTLEFISIENTVRSKFIKQ
jgi:hypothetical protein